MIVNTEQDRKLMKKIARRLKDRMEYLDINQHELARRTGLSQTAICHLLRARKMPLLSTALKIAKSLNMSITDLIN